MVQSQGDRRQGTESAFASQANSHKITQRLAEARAEIEANMQSLLHSASTKVSQHNVSLVDAILEQETKPSPSSSESRDTLTNASSKSTAVDDHPSDRGPVQPTGFVTHSLEVSHSTLQEDQTLPVYLLGGMQIHGLGDVLESALALLYVARLGLRESELWAMLAKFRSDSRRQVDENAADSKVEQLLLDRLYPIRGALLDNLRYPHLHL